MAISINTNIAATRASQFLATNHQNLQNSLDRLSSGRRITQPSDDAGGLAVSMKLEHSINGLRGIASNISNAISLLQVQDGSLESAANIVSRIGELKSMYSDVTKSSSDQDLYENELEDLVAQLEDIHDGTSFNGIRLFADTAATLTVNLDTAGSSQMTIDQADLKTGTEVADVVSAGTAGAGSLADGDLTSAQITDALEEIADLRATNGGKVKRLQYALADTESQISNLTAANGRIMDVDIAAESANLAKQQILVQASAAMTAQANMSNDIALMLLQ